MGYITPAAAQIMLEWHFDCFGDFRLAAQNVLIAPYRCQRCLERIVHGDNVICFVVGQETDEWHSICERRGYDVYSIRHVQCETGEGIN
jgi:hypothetical protein